MLDLLVNNWAKIGLAALVFYVVFEQISFARKAKGLPGPAFSWPLIGGIVEMVLHPFDFWHNAFAKGPLR